MNKTTLIAMTGMACLFTNLAATAQNLVTTFAGNGASSTVFTARDSVLGTNAALGALENAIADSAGNVYIADAPVRRIWKIDANGVMTTFAGGGTTPYFSGATATAVSIESVNYIAFDKQWNMYACFGTSIKKIDGAGVITDFAGSSVSTYTGDGGAATAAGISLPLGMAFDNAGNAYFSDERHHVIRKIDASGIITTVAGTGYTTSGGDGAFSGDGGPATAADLNYPGELAIDAAGDLYISDGYNYRVRKVSMTTGIINTVVGSGAIYPATCVYAGEGGPATDARIDPIGMAIDSLGQLYVSGIFTDRICKVDAAGNIHTVAGTGAEGFGGDGGNALSAVFENIDWISFDKCGNLLATDEGNNRLRKITFNPPTVVPTITITGPDNAVPGTTVTLHATVGGAGTGYTVSWLRNGVLFGTSTAPTFTYVKTSGTDTILATVADHRYNACFTNNVSAKIMVSDQTVIVNPVAAGIMRIYPNPVSDLLYIDLNNTGEATCEIVNSVGQLVYEGILSSSGTSTVGTQALRPGIYFLSIKTARGVTMHRFVKE